MISEQQYNTEEKLDFSIIIAIFRTLKFLKKGENPMLEKAGLTSSQFSVLEILYHKGPLKVCELLDKTLSSGGNMTLVLKNLKKEGLILKTKDPDDARVSIVQLTTKGFQLIGSIFPGHIKEVQSFVSPLDKGEKSELVRLLKKLSRV